MDIQVALKSLEVFELRLSEFYAQLQEAYAQDEEASQVFRRMYLEEKSRAYLIQFGLRLVRQNPRLFGEVDLEPAEIEGALSKLKGLVSLGRAPELGQAVRLGVELEAEAAEFLYRKAIRNSGESVSHLLARLGAAPCQHRCALCELGSKRGYLPALQAGPCPVAVAQASCMRGSREGST